MAGSVHTLVCAWMAFLPAARANSFLGLSEPIPSKIFAPLLEELEGVLGQEQTASVEQRVDVLTESLRSTFLALPKTAEGNLEPAAVRYLLHRYFVDRHGWYVQGFETAGDAWNSSSPTAILEQHVGSGAREAFEERLVHRGFSLHEAAVLAATLESLVHSETIQRLHAAYELAGLSKVEEHAKDSDVDTAIDTYMMMYVLGLNHSTLTQIQVAVTQAKIDEVYKHWGETKKWVREVKKEVLSAHPESRGSFSTTTRVLEQVADKYGRWQDQECSVIKDTLVKLERSGTGRVPLATFYEAALNGSRFLSESKAYLRQSGALDETDPEQPSVIIPNYVNGNSNCVASSKFYAVCCISECEALLGHLERQLMSPTAGPGRIVELVSQLPSATVEAPRNLPATLVQRLDEIAAQHSGQVPLHGRLFMQWLHHAYPRECSFPLLSGTSKPVTARQWKEQTGEKPTADVATMQWHIEEERRVSARRSSDSVANPLFETVDEVPWTAEEELFVSHQTLYAPKTDIVDSVGKGVLLLALACSMVMALMHMLTMAKESISVLPAVEKYSV